MNILVVFLKHKITYSVNNINDVVCKLKKHQHNVVYITEKQTTNTTYIINFNSKSILLTIWNCLYISYIIKKHKIQLLHSISYSNIFSCNLASKITNTPIINTCYAADGAILKQKNSMNDIFQFKNTTELVNHLENNYQTIYITKKCKEIPIIMYHRFIKHNNEKGNSSIYINIKKLEKHFQFLKKRGYETLTFSDLHNKGLIHRFEHDKKFLIITIDDGYEDNYHLLLPLLKKYNFKAVIYVVTGVNYNKWDVDKLQEPQIPLMSTEQIKEMVASGLVEIGGHTMTHPDLTKLTQEQQYQEIYENKLQLENIIKQDIISFAYPYGLFNKVSKTIVKKSGYKFAVAVEKNAVDIIHQEIYQIKRIQISPWDNTLFFWFKTTGYYWQMDKTYHRIIKLLVLIKKILRNIYYITTFYKRILNR